MVINDRSGNHRIHLSANFRLPKFAWDSRSPDMESIDSPLRQMCVSISERCRFARIPERMRYRTLRSLRCRATPRACCLRAASSPLHVAAASASASRHTQREAGGSAGGAPGGATGWPASPSPGGCNLLLRDPATYVGLLSPSFMCPPTISLVPSLAWFHTHDCVCRHYKSVFPFLRKSEDIAF